MTSDAAELSPDDHLAQRLRGFGPLGILAILIILAGNAVLEPLSAVLVLIWARLSRTPWREIGYVRPKSWPRANVCPWKNSYRLSCRSSLQVWSI